MKSKLFILFIAIIGIFYASFNNIKTEASILEEPMRMASRLDSFNTIKGYISDDFFEENHDYDQYNFAISRFIESGYLEAYIEGYVDSLEVTIKEKVYFLDGFLIGVKYYYNEDLFFDCELIDDEINIIVDNEIYFGDYYNNPDLLFIKNDIYYDTHNANFYNSSMDIVSTIDNNIMLFLYAATVKENTYYESNDCHIVMPYNHKLTDDEIIDEITINDLSDNPRFKIIDSTYDYSSSDIGTYSLRIVAMDNYNHYTIQDVIVDVVDVIKPKIEQIKPIIVSYNTELIEEELITNFIIDEYSDYECHFDLTNYNKNILGTYNLSLTVTDIYDNSNTINFDVVVNDTIAPVIGFTNVSLDNLEKRSIEDIISLSMLSINDGYDGNVMSLAEVISLDDYENNYNKQGVYRFSVTAYDNSNNISQAIIYVKVVDVDYPTITLGKYLVLTEKGEALTKDAIINLFNNLGYDLEDSDIDGDCFNLAELNGQYDFTYIIDENINDGIISTEEIELSFPIEVDNKIIEDNSFNITWIIIISISSLIILSSIPLGIVLYKKRH